MKQLDLLWEYQEKDKELDEYNKMIEEIPSRVQLIKLKKYLLNKQGLLKKLNEEVEKKNLEISKISHEYDHIEGSIKKVKEQIEHISSENIDQIEKVLNNINNTKSILKKKKYEINDLITVIDKLETDIKKAAYSIINGKKKYDEVKVVLDKEMSSHKEEHDELLKNRQAAAENIKPELIKKYENLKTNRHVVLVHIHNNRCGGCNMELASLVVKNVLQDKKVVQCENCGRILYGDDTVSA